MSTIVSMLPAKFWTAEHPDSRGGRYFKGRTRLGVQLSFGRVNGRP